jgi:drug/metabolite transporter (DMT)-like permease
VPPVAVALVLFAGVLHVTWNVLLKTAGDPLRTAATGIVVAAVVAVPAAIVGWLAVGRPVIPPEVVGLGILSAAIEVAFFVLLSAAYRRGDLSVVYPIARGTAPLLAVLLGVVALGERLPPAGWLGVALLLGGLLALQRPWRLLRAASRQGRIDPAVPFALATGVSIAGYSAVDRVATQLVAPWLYAAFLWAGMAVGLGVLVVTLDARARARGAAPAPIDRPRAAVGGILTLAAYLLVLGALAIAPLAAVAPLRESAIVLASGWGVFRLREASGRPDAALRLASAALVLAGALLLALGGSR